MRFTVNLYYVKNDKDNLGHTFPLNTFKTNNSSNLLEELKILLDNNLSGINKIVIIDSLKNVEELAEINVGQAPRYLE